MRDKVRRWIKDPGFWSLADQSAVSAGNFATAILLARALVPGEYGVYALLFALMLFLISVHSAVITYGLSLHGAAGTEAGLRSLAGGSLTLTAGLGTVLGAAAGLVAILLRNGSIFPWILLSLLFWQLQETTRRALMSRLWHRRAIWGDALSYLGQAGCMGWLFVDHRLSLVTAFQVMAATSAAAWLFQVGQLKLRPSHFRGCLRLLPKFWGAGRWALLANFAQAFIGQALLWFLALRGMASVASFQSLLNLLRAINPVMFAIGSVLLPAVAVERAASANGLRSAKRYSLLGGLLLLPYLAVIFVIPGVVLRFLYGSNSTYAGLGTELRVLIIGAAFAYSTHILGSYFYGLSKSEVVFRCQLIGAGVTVASGLILATQGGVMGASIAYDLTFTAETGAFVWFLWHRPGGASWQGVRSDVTSAHDAY